METGGTIDTGTSVDDLLDASYAEWEKVLGTP